MFAGCGGFRLGMESAGFSTVFANDIDPRAKLTYDLNSETKLTLGDITDIPLSSIPEFDCLTGGFPCQPFSRTGKKEGFKDSRGNLFFHIASIIKNRRPSSFILENVAHLYRHDNGNTFNVIKNTLRDELGYNVFYKTLSSMHYGIPQARERVFIVGLDKTTRFEFPEPIHLGISVRDLLEDDVAEKYYYRSDHKHYKVMSKVVKDPDKVYQWRWSYVRENKKNVCPTLLASNSTPILIYDKGVRTLTPREQFRLQGFPDDFLLPDTLSDRSLYHQAGNSVTTNVVKAIADRIRISMS